MITFVRRFLISSMLFIGLWFSGFLLFLHYVPATENHSDTRADAVVVLTGGQGRVDLGLKRLAEGKAAKLFITGVNNDATPEHVLVPALQRATDLLELPQPADVEFGYNATSTIGNAEEVLEWVRQEQVKSLRLVTANYHMPRSLQEFRAVLPREVTIIPDPVFPKGFDQTAWWRGGKSAQLLFSEYHKLIASYLRHQVIEWNQSS